MENLCFGANFYCDNIKLVEFGNNVKIGNNVSINTTYFDTIKKEMVSNGIKIGDNVVIGNNVVISYGVTINNNAIVMDGSVVLRDVLENEVVSGNPINTVSFNKKEEINLDDVIIYDLDNVLITKDSEANLYLVLKSNNKRILIFNT